MKRKILVLVIVIAAIGGVIIYRMYNEKAATAADSDAEVTIDAKALFAAFLANDTAAGTQYNSKVIQVSGSVQRVEAGPRTNVYLESGDESGAVVCEFDSTFKSDWSTGKQVSLKGICAGFSGLPGMSDVVLQRCAAVE